MYKNMNQSNLNIKQKYLQPFLIFRKECWSILIKLKLKKLSKTYRFKNNNKRRKKNTQKNWYKSFKKIQK